MKPPPRFPAWGQAPAEPALAPTPPAGAGASPCVNICRMDPVTGWCEGCLRTLDEIATWTLLDVTEREQVLATLGARRRQRSAPGPTD